MKKSSDANDVKSESVGHKREIPTTIARFRISSFFGLAACAACAFALALAFGAAPFDAA